MGWICLNDECTIRFYSLANELWSVHNSFLYWAYNFIINNFIIISFLVVAFFIGAVFVGFRRLAQNGF